MVDIHRTADLMNFIEPIIMFITIIYLRKQVDKLKKDTDNLADLIGTETSKSRRNKK